MADSKDSSNFFRKVVKFVARSSSEWAELSSPPSGGHEAEFAKSELKAMIERKRRNDFVRKREFDMLRKVRREGLTTEQLATLETSSRIDDIEDRSDTRPHQVKAKIDEIEQQMVGERLSGMTKPNSSFYAALTQPSKLEGPPLGKEIPVLGMRPDEIIATPPRPYLRIPREPAHRPSQYVDPDIEVPPAPIVPARPLPKFDLLTRSATLNNVQPASSTLPATLPLTGLLSTPPSERLSVPLPEIKPIQNTETVTAKTPQPLHVFPEVFFPAMPIEAAPASPKVPLADIPVRAAPAHSIFSSLDDPISAWPTRPKAPDIPSASSPLLIDPALISQDTKPLVQRGPLPTSAADSSDVASDGLKINGVENAPEFEALMIAFANADFPSCEQSLLSLIGVGGSRENDSESWLVLFDFYQATGEAAKFEELALQYCIKFGLSSPQWFSMPAMMGKSRPEKTEPVTGDSRQSPLIWVCLDHLDQNAVARLESISMQMPQPWVFDWTNLKSIDTEACHRLTKVLRSLCSQRVQIHWVGGAELFKILNDMCVVGNRDVDPVFWDLRFEVLRMANRAAEFDDAAMDYCITYEVSPPSWVAPRCDAKISASKEDQAPPFPDYFFSHEAESRRSELSQTSQTKGLEISGQLLGDITETLAQLDQRIKEGPVISVSCTRLIRLDFMAAGHLLNWVLTKCHQNRSVIFTDVHRLVALFLGTTGISRHAKVKVKTV
ncbi:MAG: hypothetical protein ACK53K_07240 [Burkholderiales bacterium]